MPATSMRGVCVQTYRWAGTYRHKHDIHSCTCDLYAFTQWSLSYIIEKVQEVFVTQNALNLNHFGSNVRKKKWTGFQWHISAFFELIVRPTSKSCFHIFLLLTGIYHSIHTAWAGLRFPWSLRKGRHESGSLDSKDLAHLVPKGLEALDLQYWSPFPLVFDSMLI